MNSYNKVKDYLISSLSVNLLRVGLLLPAIFISSASFAAEPVCAVVKLEIKQELTLERQGFEAVMKINNGLATLPLENLSISVQFKDENGLSVFASNNVNVVDTPGVEDPKFFIATPTVTGMTGQTITGAEISTGVVAPSTTAEASWLIVPTVSAGGSVPSGTLYFVGATLTYTLGGEEQTTVVTPDSINVKPLPLLALDYFLPSDVYADDPFTANIIEPIEPFSLGVRVHNTGAATATGVKIDSAQPKIIENKEGLLVDFLITGSTVNDLPSTNSLLLNLGNIAPKTAAAGRWTMSTTLAGRFTEFTASVAHSDGLGGELTSLIPADAIQTHLLLRDVRVDVAGRDAVRDYLAYETFNVVNPGALMLYESNGNNTPVTNQSDALATNLSANGTDGTYDFHTFTIPVTAGFSYAKLPNPMAGTQPIAYVVRNDGRSIPLDNVWLSKTFNSTNQTWSHYINLFDANSTGSYSIAFSAAPQPPTLTVPASSITHETNPTSITISASDTSGGSPTLSVQDIPTGALFTDNGNGTGVLQWTPSVGQAGSYTVTFVAADATLGIHTSSQGTFIRVNPVWDTDGDGMDDQWELDHFGNLNQDGTGDSDNDGISDLLEYQNGYNPKLAPPVAPVDLAVFPGNAEVLLNWPAVTNATSYNLYWSNTAGVTPATGNKIEAAVSPYTHTGLTNDVSYYYVLTAIGEGGESTASVELSVIPGQRDWGPASEIVSTITTELGNAAKADIAFSADGSAIAVWQQSDGTRTNIWANHYTSINGWGSARLIETDDLGNAEAPRVAIDDTGRAIAVWQQSNGTVFNIVAARFVPATGWGLAKAIETTDLGDAVQPQVAIQADGPAVVLWSQNDGTVLLDGSQPANTIWSNQYNVITESWSTATRIEANTAAVAVGTDIALDQSGNAIALWSESLDGVTFNILSNRFDATSGSWAATPVAIRSGVSGDSLFPYVLARLAVNDSGNAVAAWSEFSSIDGVSSAWAAHFVASTTTWGSAVNIENDNLGSAYLPDVILDKNDNATAVWIHFDGTRRNVLTNRYSAGSWGAIASQISSTSTTHLADASLVELEVDGQGNVMAVWPQNDGVQLNIWANRFDIATALWEGAHIIDTSNVGDAESPQLAANSKGSVLSVWQQFNGNYTTIWSNSYVPGNEGVPNISPIAIGVDLSVNEQTIVTLDGSASFDQDGSGLVTAYSWTQTAGTPVTLTGVATATPSFTSPTLVTTEVLTFKLSVTDDAAATSTTLVNVTVNPVNVAPVAIAGVDQPVDEQTTVTLSGSGTDTDGMVDSYSWAQISGQTVTLTTANAAIATFDAPLVTIQQGVQTLVFELTVTDNEGASAKSQLNVLVSPVNAAPIVSAGIAQTVDEQTLVTLIGSGTDVDSGVASYTWSQVSGLPVIFTDTATATTSFTAPFVLLQDGPQTIVLRLTVVDNEGSSVSDDVSIVVNAVNVGPVANAGLSRNENEKTLVTLDASTSADSDGTIEAYQWTQVLGVGELGVVLSNANAAVTTFTTPEVLVQNNNLPLTFNVEVTDNEGAKHTSTVVISVQAVNADPVANAGLSRNENEKTLVTLDASTSADSDGTIEAYQWTQVLGVGELGVVLSNANAAVTTFTTPEVLVQNNNLPLTFDVTVTDNEGATHTARVVITVQAVNADPVANAGLSRNENEKTLVTLDASTSADSDGTIEAYQWTQVLGVGELGVVLSNANAAVTTFTTPEVLVQNNNLPLTFDVTVTDNEGATHTARVVITVQAVNADPVADAGLDASHAEYVTVTLNGTGTDSDGLISTYQWSQVSGYPVILSDSTSAITTFVAPAVYQDEVLSFQLIVADNETGVSIADTVNITIYSVNPDDDADGMPDLYEISQFGDLTRDGTADFDNDGYSDLLEYQNGTNPLALTLAAPTGLKAVAANAQVTLSWNDVASAAGYNVYWDTIPNVTKSSNVISNVNSGYVHTGLSNGTTYYYVVTTLSTGDESIVSNEISAKPGLRAWQEPAAIDNGVNTYLYPQIATNRNGNSVVIYEQFDGINYSAFATMFNKQTGWSVPQVIETGDLGNVFNPQVSVDDNGNAVAVWEQYNGTSYNVWANVYDAQSSSWGIAEQIETSLTGGTEYFMPQVAMSQSDSAVVTWQKHDGLTISIWASRFVKGTGWSQAVKLESDDLNSAYLPQVAVNSAGHAAVVWEQRDATTGIFNTWNASYDLTTGWSAAMSISNSSNSNAYDAQIALNDNGKAVAVWEQFDGIRYNVWSNIAQNGVWATAQRVEYNTTGAGEYFYPQIAMDKQGTATAVWQQFDGRHVSVWSNRLVDGLWETATRIEVNDITEITNPRVDMDEEGNAVAVWEQYDDSGKNSLISIWANRYTQGSGWETAQPIETIDNETMWYPEVSIDAYGNANAVWFHNGITEDNIFVAANILQTNPPTANAGADQSGFVTKDVVSLDATMSTDVDGTIVSYHWHQLSGIEVTLSGKNTANPTFAVPRVTAAVEQIFILTVTDNSGLTSSDTVVITLGDTATPLFINLLDNSGKVATNGLASGLMPEQWALNHKSESVRTRGKSKSAGRLESLSTSRNAVNRGRNRPAKNNK